MSNLNLIQFSSSTGTRISATIRSTLNFKSEVFCGLQLRIKLAVGPMLKDLRCLPQLFYPYEFFINIELNDYHANVTLKN